MSLSEPHTSVAALQKCVCMFACLLACLLALACLWPYTINFKSVHLNISRRLNEHRIDPQPDSLVPRGSYVPRGLTCCIANTPNLFSRIILTAKLNHKISKTYIIVALFCNHLYRIYLIRRHSYYLFCCSFCAATIRGRLLFEGGYYSRATFG